MVVHGVGVKQAGISSDLLAAALQDDDGKGAETRLPPHSSDDYVLLESSDYDSSGKASVFPARVRRYRSYEVKDGSLKNERVIADFYWGDVTAFGVSVVNLALAYFKVAMGLSHAIRENAREVYPDTRTGRFIGALARGAALTIHGPIIALNIVLLFGLLLAAIAKLILPLEADNLLRVQIVLVGVAAVGGSWFLLRRGGSFLYRHLLIWILLSGFAFLIVGVPEIIAGTGPQQFPGAKFVQWVDDKLTSFQCSVNADKAAEFTKCKESYTGGEETKRGLFIVGLRLLEVMWACWLLVFACWLLVFVQQIAVSMRGLIGPATNGKPQASDTSGKPQAPATDAKPRTPNLIASAIGLMSLLWFLLIAALWGAVLKMPPAFNLNVPEPIVAAALNTISAAVIVLILLGLVAGYVLRLKKELKGAKFPTPATYVENNGARAQEYADKYRLLIAPGLLWVLWTFLPLVIGITVLVYFESTVGLQQFLAKWTVPIIFGVLTIGSFLVYKMNAEFSAGLGILADVLAYLNNASWTSVDGSASPTWLERLLPGGTNAANPHGYWLRRRIHDRLDVLVRSLIRDEKPAKLDIVSHSQGTMIAIDLIRSKRGPEWLALLQKYKPNGEMRLVTMGSPYTHLYGTYFPSSFPTLAKPVGDQKVVSDWVNIFRIDDFVGTHIGNGTWPKEFPVVPNGHTNYWVDRKVVTKLRDFLK